MATVLLVDDERLFKAVEGTCLRREGCVLLKAAHGDVPAQALARRPDLIIAAVSDDESRSNVVQLGADRSIASIPILVLDLTPVRVERGAVASSELAAEVSRLTAVRESPVQLLPFRRQAGRSTTRRGAAIAADARPSPRTGPADALIDEAIGRFIPVEGLRVDRVVVSVPVRCSGAGIAATLRTKNVSPTGLFLKTAVPLPPGRRFKISFHLPVFHAPGGRTRAADLRAGDAASSGLATVSGTCEVVRRVAPQRHGGRPTGVEEGEDDLIPGLGVRFVEIHGAGSAALQRFVGSTAAAPSGAVTDSPLSRGPGGAPRRRKTARPTGRTNREH